MTDSLDAMKQRFIAMLVGDLVLMAIAGGFAFAYFGRDVGWAVWGFVGFLVAAFVLQLWFIRGVSRQNKGG
jgi:O-antigen/teichoic acid export membrane protein